MNEKMDEVLLTENREKLSKENRVISYLKNLAKPPRNGAALANLRRGLGKPPRTVLGMYPYLGQFLSEETKPRYENTVFIIAALFAFYPDAPGNIGNLGASLRTIKDESGGIEKRFVALLNSDEEDLPRYLRQIIGLLKAKDVAVNWNELFFDVRHWSNENLRERVQSRWAKEFWKDNQTNKQKGENL